ncbi:MAG: hypothetical protein COB02_17380 [Candidatus Cloacimonadota bacterium]|nr:MAG: hypothetical protein COB02_17380 [Candidatus Cloacimonadota bacterium]
MNKFYQLKPIVRVLVLVFITFCFLTFMFIFNVKNNINNIYEGGRITSNTFEPKTLKDSSNDIKSSLFVKLLLELQNMEVISYRNRLMKRKSLLKDKEKLKEILKKWEIFSMDIIHPFLINNSYKLVPNYRLARRSNEILLKNLLEEKLKSKSFNSIPTIKALVSYLLFIESSEGLLIGKMVSSLMQNKLIDVFTYLLRNNLLSEFEQKNLYERLNLLQVKNNTFMSAMNQEKKLMFKIYSSIYLNNAFSSEVLEFFYGNPVDEYNKLFKSSNAFSSISIDDSKSIHKLHPFLQVAIPSAKSAKNKIDKTYYQLLILIEEIRLSLKWPLREMYFKELGIQKKQNEQEISILVKQSNIVYKIDNLSKEALIEKLVR